MLPRIYFEPEWSIYLIENSIGRGYIGISSDVEHRVRSHKNGDASSLPILESLDGLRLIHQQYLGNFVLASRYESWHHSMPYEEAKKSLLSPGSFDFFIQEVYPSIIPTSAELEYLRQLPAECPELFN